MASASVPGSVPCGGCCSIRAEFSRSRTLAAAASSVMPGTWRGISRTSRILLVREIPRQVPGITELAAAASVRDRENSALIEQQPPHGTEPGTLAEAIASVAREQGRGGAVEPGTARDQDGHRDARSVLRDPELAQHLNVREFRRRFHGER